MTHIPTTAKLAAEFADDFRSCVDRYVRRNHPGNPNGWPGDAQRSASEQLRLAIAAKLVAGSHDELGKLIDAYRAADGAIEQARFMADEEYHDIAAAKIDDFAAIAEHLTRCFTSEIKEYAA